MSTTLRSGLFALVVVLAALAAYHLLLVPRRAAREGELEALRATVAARGETPPPTASVLRRLIDLEVRLEALEARVPEGEEPGERTFTITELDTLKAMLEALDRRERARVVERQVLERLRQGGIEVPPESEAAVLEVVGTYLVGLLEARGDASRGPGERHRGAVAAHERMAEALRGLLAPDLAEAVIERFPAPPGPASDPDGPR